MNRFRIAVAVLAALVASSSTMALAQATPADTAKPAAESKPVAAKKVPPKKVARKPVKKDAAPKAAAPNAAASNAAPKQASKTYSTGPTTLRDRDGNVIPTNPEAYNVDSARK